jgi:hypothetical protein
MAGSGLRPLNPGNNYLYVPAVGGKPLEVALQRLASVAEWLEVGWRPQGAAISPRDDVVEVAR